MFTAVKAILIMSLIWAFVEAKEKRFNANQQEQISQQLGIDYTEDIFDYIFDVLCSEGSGDPGTGNENTDFCCPLDGEGPHDIDCLANWWTDTGCSLDSPSSPTQNDMNVDWWNDRSVADVKYDMEEYTANAQYDEEYNVKCHGTINPNYCNKASGPGPHSLSCLIQWWGEAGCSLDGTQSPVYKPDLYFWQQHDVQSVKEDMALFFQYGVNDYLDYSLKCFGQYL